jgi:hypothetical protein
MKINSILKLILVFGASAIAATATFPYGYKFAALFHLNSHTLYLSIACLLGGVAWLANTTLGSYSLLNMKKGKQAQNVFLMTMLSIFGAVPMGFFSYAAYENALPATFNVINSLIVIIVNTGINYTALFNLLKSSKELIKKMSEHAINWVRFSFCTVGGITGAVVSLTAYLATTDGLANIFLHYHLTPSLSLRVAAILAIIIWLPFGALYVNSTQAVVAKIYNFFSEEEHAFRKIKFSNIIFILFALMAGTAFAQMVLDFYNPHNMIPVFFKLPLIQTIASNGLMPLALLSSAAVNYFALVEVIRYFKKK